MKRRPSIGAGLAVVLLAVAGVPAPAGAITNGTPDGNAHPYVGVLVDDYSIPGYYQRFCTATLVAPGIMVSAAHCFYGFPLDQVWVSFDPVYTPGTSQLIHGTAVLDPTYADYKGQYGHSDSRDIAVVRLDAAPGIAPARLPTADLLSSLDLTGQSFTVVGYGRTRVDKTKGPNNIEPNFDPDVRDVAVAEFRSLQPNVLTISANPATGDGGSCYGDSGGPDFLGESDVLVALIATGDASCRATGRDYRIDTDSARAFLASQGVPVP